MRTTRKEIKEKVKAYILSFYDPAEYNTATAAEALKLDMDAIKDHRAIITDYQAGAELAKAGNYCIYFDDARQALKEWGADDGKDHDDAEAWAFYCHLIGRESAEIVRGL